jgi:hypothetical protein
MFFFRRLKSTYNQNKGRRDFFSLIHALNEANKAVILKDSLIHIS